MPGANTLYINFCLFKQIVPMASKGLKNKKQTRHDEREHNTLVGGVTTAPRGTLASSSTKERSWTVSVESQLCIYLVQYSATPLIIQGDLWTEVLAWGKTKLYQAFQPSYPSVFFAGVYTTAV